MFTNTVITYQIDIEDYYDMYSSNVNDTYVSIMVALSKTLSST